MKLTLKSLLSGWSRGSSPEMVALPHLLAAARPVIEVLEGRQLMAVDVLSHPGGDLGPADLSHTSQTGLSIQSAATLQAQALAGTDINSTPAGATTDLGDGSGFDVTAGGIRIDDFADTFHFSHLQKTGDFDVRVRVQSLAALAGVTNTKAGLMARESLTAGSRHVFAGATTGNGFRFSHRSTTNGDSRNPYKGGTPDFAGGAWVRLTRVGNTFTGYRGTDGRGWTQIYRLTLALPSTVHVGLATSARSETETTTAQYRQLSGLIAQPPAPVAPATPTGLSAQGVSTSKIVLSWNASAGAVRYYVQRQGPGEPGFTDYTTVTATTLDDSGLTPSSTYAYRVRAEASGTLVSAYTAAAEATTHADVPATAPAVPQNLQAQATGATSVHLSWGASSGANLYRIQRKGPGDTDFVAHATTVLTSFNDADLQPGATYAYQVQAENGQLVSGYTDAAEATTPPESTVAPAAPTNLAASAPTATRVNVSWNPSAGATHYRVQRKGPADADFVDLATSTTTTLQDNTADAGTTYAYRVRAEIQRQSGDLVSDYTAAAEATTPAANPALTSTDVNSVGASGTTVVTEGVDYDVTAAAGSDIWANADKFRFAHKSVTGDFDYKVRVAGLTGGNTKFKAGLMARETLDAASRNLFANVTSGDGIRLSQRAATGGTTTNLHKTGTTFQPVWLRLKRAGNTFTAYRSADGVNWTKMTAVTATLPATLHLGLAVSGSPASAVAPTAQFRGLTDLAPVVLPPPPDNTPVGPRITWANGANAPYASQESISIQVGSRLFFMGGYVDNDLNSTNQAWSLDMNTGVWTRIANLPLTQTHTGIASDDSRFIYLAGGQVGNKGSTDIRRECFRYEIATDTWSAFTPLPEARLGGGLAYVNGNLHYFGGDISDRITVSDKHWSIAVDADGNATGDWTERAAMIDPGDHFSVAVHNGRIYAVGGEHDHGRDYIQHNPLSEYDPVTDTWRRLAPLPVASSHFETGTLIVHGRLVALGGQADDERLMKDVRVYDFATNTWTTLSTGLPAVRKGGVAYFHNNQISYTAGRGYTSSGSKLTMKNTWVGTVSNPWW